MTPSRHLIEEPWAKVPLSLMDTAGITLSDIRLYVHLDMLAGKRGWWYGSQEAISTETGLPERTIQRSLRALTDAGFIGVERLGVQHATVNQYFVHARVRAVESDERHANLGGSLAADGGSQPPTVAAPSIYDLTDQKPKSKKRDSSDSVGSDLSPEPASIDGLMGPEARRAWQARVSGSRTR